MFLVSGMSERNAITIGMGISSVCGNCAAFGRTTPAMPLFSAKNSWIVITVFYCDLSDLIV